ncbi:ras-responsive element-binding protein 1 [Trichogramma pretiosum]|uniref:ras-responsive element-binding protein 1 n=1 Tax=Trichogramma pretiosum TaxID=7493 RepID=UPI0006C9876E|nr:ras-responsive element-binding protein 1 [Trichogramma pretiosum]
MAFTASNGLSERLRAEHHSVSPTSQHSCTDSDGGGSSDSEPQRPAHKRRIVHDEYNNNEVTKRQCIETDRNDPRSLLLADKKSQEEEQQQQSSQQPRSAKQQHQSDSGPHTCDICGQQDFPTYKLLDAHLEQSHPDDPISCPECDVAFKNYRTYSVHRYMSHSSSTTTTTPTPTTRQSSAEYNHNSVVGFSDLTYVDFTSDKFPSIARAACERARHRPSSSDEAHLSFQCDKCQRAFPCRSAVEAHEFDCGRRSPPFEPEHSRRNDFFAGLDLQNKSSSSEVKDSRDLADIQSIISVTSGPILQGFGAGHHGEFDHGRRRSAHLPTEMMSMSSEQQQQLQDQHPQEEEAQDAFAAEFRRMKLKGEFPCRLCSAVFPNLRALKGHNRQHMNVSAGQSYPCNMCSYSHPDKATVIRHLRSHNGDRPYECSLCNYAFTTKANCERHVRNRHGKVTRDEIKRALIYHPNEDATNDSSLEQSSPRSGSLRADDVRKSHIYLPGAEKRPEIHADNILSSLRVKDVEAVVKAQRAVDEFEEPLRKRHSDEADSHSSDGDAAVVRSAASQEALMDRKKDSPIHRYSRLDEIPLDLSMDVLDLSKKAKAAAAAKAVDAIAIGQDARTSKNGLENSSNEPKDVYSGSQDHLLLTQALLKATNMGAPPSSLESLYANAQMIYRNLPGFPLPFNMFPFFAQDLSTKDKPQKELVRGLQTSGGSLVEPSSNSPVVGHSLGHSPNPINSEHNDYVALINQKLMNKSGSSSGGGGGSSSGMHGRADKIETSPSSNSVKMVIKNGVLMPKQKQRRYRTERPFTCEHCSARFTLRSNMERHIKQQHPQHWSQRPRGGHSNRGRPPANPPTLLQSLRHSHLPSSYPTLLPKLSQSYNYEKHEISDQVKYAILTQHLKSNKSLEHESDEDLVIDEESVKEEKEGNKSKDKTLSLLRDKLESGIVNQSHEADGLKVEIDTKQELASPESDSKLYKKRANTIEDELDQSRIGEKTSERGGVKAEKQESEDLASVSEILDNASQRYQQFQPQYISDEEGLVASTSDCSDDKSDSFNSGSGSSSGRKKKKKLKKKKKAKSSAYSLAPNRVLCPYCQRAFPWTSSLRRHILTHTGQKPFQCTYCSLLFTTKSNCDRHLLRKHKNCLNLNLIRNRARSTSSPEVQEAAKDSIINQTTTTTSNTTTAANVASSISASHGALALRNVPERPYKCHQCPSSTFSTLGNLKKHRTTKHPLADNQSYTKANESNKLDKPNKAEDGEEMARAEEEEVDKVRSYSVESDASLRDSPQPFDYQTAGLAEYSSAKRDFRESQMKASNDQSDYDSQSSGVSDHMESSGSVKAATSSKTLMMSSSSSSANNNNNNNNSSSNNNNNNATSPSNNDAASRSRRQSPHLSPGMVNSDTPFKCHLCDCGFPERQDCLDHIRDNHEKSYEVLVAKGALDMEIDGVDELMPQQLVAQQQQASNASDGEDKKGRFPDYSNRKVVCAFCMRRFWSAEDLRRHMRTHTGERPFSCDICSRRFTLKHSMLRHRKKHESVDSSMYVGTSGDEDYSINQHHHHHHHHHQLAPVTTSGMRTSLPQVAAVATADAAPTSLTHFSPYEKLSALQGKLMAGSQHQQASSLDSNDNNDNDLISNLLGIKGHMVDEVLQASADDAAKLLGVKGNQE